MRLRSSNGKPPLAPRVPKEKCQASSPAPKKLRFTEIQDRAAISSLVMLSETQESNQIVTPSLATQPDTRESDRITIDSLVTQPTNTHPFLLRADALERRAESLEQIAQRAEQRADELERGAARVEAMYADGQ